LKKDFSSRVTALILTMPTTPTSSVTPYPKEDEVDYSTDDDKVDSPEPRDGSMGLEKHSVSKTKDITPEQLNASDVRSDLPKQRLVSIHNCSMKAFDRHSTFCNSVDIALIRKNRRAKDPESYFGKILGLDWGTPITPQKHFVAR
jgi:hypothetical protein